MLARFFNVLRLIEIINNGSIDNSSNPFNLFYNFKLLRAKFVKLSDFDFHLPDELIAQEPAKIRDHSNLSICHGNGVCEKKKFYEIYDYIKPNDLLIFNNSKVINAQLSLKKNESKIHVNLNKELDNLRWKGFARPAKKLKTGDVFSFEDQQIIIENKDKDGVITFRFNLTNLSVLEFLDKYGEVPLPPYIARDEQKPEDKERYQSVLAKYPGSVAAPTASLHFTTELIERIKAKGAELAFVTLHVGAGTYLPMKTENIDEHVMHAEYASIAKDTAKVINQAKKDGRRIVVIGTTAMRTVESFTKDGILEHGTKDTSIFIKPGHKFHIPDCLITNFHLPKSTLFMLICAFSGFDEMHKAYKIAIENKMKFFSYGDAMMISKKE